jgi:hypothetical protein
MSGRTAMRVSMRGLHGFSGTLRFLLPCTFLLLAAPSALAQEISRSGAFNGGLHIDLGVGVNELLSVGPFDYGFYPRPALAIELGEHYSIQVVVRMHELIETGELTLDGTTFAPGFLYRFRDPESPWVFGLGGGVRIGEMMLRRELVGLQPTSNAKAQKVPSFILSPDATFMLELWPTHWFAAKLAIGYAFVPTADEGAPVHALEQALMITFCL